MEPFKNNFSPQLVICIADHLQKHITPFERKTFEEPVLKQLENLELKERAQLIADHVHLALPDNHTERARVLRAILHPDGIEQPSDEHGISGWGMLPLTMVVGQHGLDDFDGSLSLLKEMTSRFSSEFGIRYFLLTDQERTLNIMRGWIDDPDHHVRRLVSEGTRPRLPWAMQLPRLIDDPAPMLPILEALRDDEEEYVRRSVANHLNDIAKDHPDLVAKIAHDWMKNASKNRASLVRHGLRSLIKSGHPGALKALGYGPAKVAVSRFEVLTPAVTLGGALEFELEISSTCKTSQPLIIDYVVHHMRASGKTSPKVFKWKNITLEGSKSLRGSRRHSIKPITTRRYHPGQHRVEILVNGEILCGADFVLRIN